MMMMMMIMPILMIKVMVRNDDGDGKKMMIMCRLFVVYMFVKDYKRCTEERVCVPH